MVAILIRAVFLYFLFLAIRAIYRTYKSINVIKGAAQDGQKKSTYKKKSPDGTIEAEFRHLDEP